MSGNDKSHFPSRTDLAFTRESPYGTQSEPTYSGALSFLRRTYSKDLHGVDVAVPKAREVIRQRGAKATPPQGVCAKAAAGGGRHPERAVRAEHRHGIGAPVSSQIG